MENQITIAQKRVSKILSVCLLVLISFTSFAQHGGPGPVGGNSGHGNPGGGFPGGGFPGGGFPGGGFPGGGHPGGGTPPSLPLGCNAHYMQHRDSVQNGVDFFNHPGSGAATYAWDFGDGSSSTNTNPTHVYSAEGTYYVCLTVTDTVQGGCSNTWCDSVHVFTPAPHCNAHFFHMMDSVPNGIRFISGPSSPGATYAWDFGDGNTSSSQNPSNAYAAAGTYYVCLTVTNSNSGGTCSDTYCDSVHAFTPAPHCNAHYYARRDTTVANGVQFNSGHSSPGATYAWDFGDGNTSTDANPMNAYAAAGTYYVCLTVTNSNAGGTCSDTYCDSVNTDHPGHHGPHGGPNHGHFHLKTTGESTDIQEASSDISVEVYPNPMVSSSTIHIENANGDVVLHVYQTTGQLAFTKSLVNGDNVITKENLSEGLYFYSVEDGNNNIAKGKLRVY
jgi:PKD repeat protein